MSAVVKNWYDYEATYFCSRSGSVSTCVGGVLALNDTNAVRESRRDLMTKSLSVRSGWAFRSLAITRRSNTGMRFGAMTTDSVHPNAPYRTSMGTLVSVVGGGSTVPISTAKRATAAVRTSVVPYKPPPERLAAEALAADENMFEEVETSKAVTHVLSSVNVEAEMPHIEFTGPPIEDYGYDYDYYSYGQSARFWQ